ncbi:hypothetical protein H0B56_00995 [Haloechinothrix sp. YIM 98757]|uniref:Uncharacterized protein n=1 Tax=Haloechinothrix aidingensis TaxID=2752311 RepID=A0A838A5U0_9PSEU|nr:hypothetical protein [Haloechinothrix aidingensis]MBA0124115.1 hypothetical protein [Haloechinothrix aidingensis]
MTWREEQNKLDDPAAGEDATPHAPESGDIVPDGAGGGTFLRRFLGGVFAVVLLAGGALGAYILWETATSRDEPMPSSGGAAQEEQNKLVMPDLPGSAENDSGIDSVDDLPELNYLISREIEVYREYGEGDADFRVQRLPSGSRAIVLLVTASSPSDADTAAEELRDIHLSNDADEVPEAPPGVHVTEFLNNGHEQIRGHYGSEDVIVRLEIHNTSEPTVATADFENAIMSQLDAMPTDT